MNNTPNQRVNGGRRVSKPSKFSNNPNNQYPNNYPNNFDDGSNKKKFNPLFILIPVVLIVIFIVIGVIAIGVGKSKTPPVVENNPIVTPENTGDVGIGSENTGLTDEPNVNDENSENVDVGNEEPIVSNIPDYDYDNAMLGIKFNYDSNLYIKENVEEIFNILKLAIPEGENEFNIYLHKLPSNLNVARLTTGNSDGLYISISILPFEIQKETTTLKIDGTTETVVETIEADALTDEELIEKYDLQIRQTLENSGCEIITYDKSTVQGVGSEYLSDAKKLKGIFTSRVYSGPIEVTTSTGIVDVVQCTIPVGKNAILITAVTDGREINIDKTAIFTEIVESLIVVAEKPVVETEDVSQDAASNN